MEPVNSLPINFSFVGIKIEQFAIFDENISLHEETTVTAKAQFRIEPTIRQLGVFMEFLFQKEAEKPIVKLETSCHFRIEDGSWEKCLKGNTIIFDKAFAAHLAMLTTGTARGILFAKMEGRLLSQIILPTFNVAEMLSEDITFILP